MSAWKSAALIRAHSIDKDFFTPAAVAAVAAVAAGKAVLLLPVNLSIELRSRVICDPFLSKPDVILQPTGREKFGQNNCLFLAPAPSITRSCDREKEEGKKILPRGRQRQ